MAELEFLSRNNAPPAYEIRDLGLLDDGRLCHAFALNNHGHVAGEADTTFGIHAFVWRTGEIEDLGSPGLVFSRAVDINDDGMVLGYTDLTPHGERVGCLWHEGKLIDLSALGILGPGVRAINNEGRIVGETVFSDERPPGAFLWQYGNVVDLAGPFVNGSCANDINEVGQIAGYLSTLRQYDQAFVWSDHHLYDLGFGQANAVNDHGVVAGLTYQGGGSPIACLWQNFHRREIPLPFGFASSLARDINNADDIVGEMTDNTGRKRAFLFQREYVIDLNDVIDPGLGWNLQEAHAINESGQIAGWGFLEHRHHGFLLTPSDRPGRRRRLPPPKQGAESVFVPDTVPDREGADVSFQDLILAMVQEEQRKR